jgi:hypothetical protein
MLATAFYALCHWLLRAVLCDWIGQVHATNPTATGRVPSTWGCKVVSSVDARKAALTRHPL